jgi:6-phosphogluconolactonase
MFLIKLKESKMEKFYIGCYSNKETSLPNAKGKGLSVVSLDSKTGVLTEDRVVENVDNPEYLYLNKERGELYVASERFTEFGEISILDSETLDVKYRVSSRGLSTCYVCFDETTDRLLWCNYATGNICYHNLDDGKEGNLQLEGSSINKERQSSPHPHFVALFKNTIMVSDLGCDLIHILDRDSDDLKIIGDIETPKGYGPRHMLIKSNRLYVICELIPKLLIYTYDSKSKSWQFEQELDNEKEAKMNVSNPAAIKMGKHNVLTTSNRFSDTLRQFKFFEDDKVVDMKTIKLGGKCPRDICFSKDGRWILVPLQDSDCIEVYHIDTDGMIEDKLVSVFETGTPVCAINI